MNEIDPEGVPVEHHGLYQVIDPAKAKETVELDPRKFLIDDPQQIFTGTFQFNLVPWFPFTITLSEPVPCTVILHADGKWEGSVEGLRTALAEGKSFQTDANSRIMLWLLLRQMEADQRFW